ncbi:MAG: hypothetical protein MJA27_26725, partial [Pseudanabaenales cyanobacterium]|nr:hypothetical protein [Pseudanabaenales cyanobacterium]
MDRIQAQAAKLWRLFFSSDTAANYQKTLTLTWNILKESVVFVWLLLCLVFVLVDWIWKNSVQLGQNLRNWYDNFDEPSPNNLLRATGKAVLSAGEVSFSYMLSQAKQQLGIEEPVMVKPAKPAKQIS